MAYECYNYTELLYKSDITVTKSLHSQSLPLMLMTYLTTG